MENTVATHFDEQRLETLQEKDDYNQVNNHDDENVGRRDCLILID